MLYRGVSMEMDNKNGGRILAKGSSHAVTPRLDGKWTFDGKFNFGPSESNTARAHQIESGLYGGSGVSTSRSEKVAIDFATRKGTKRGYVYVIDEDQLEARGIATYEFSNPQHPEQHEVTLILKHSLELPEQVILKKYEVNPNEKQTQAGSPCQYPPKD